MRRIRLFTALLAVATLILAGCGGTDEASPDDTTTPTPTVTPTETETPTDASGTPEPDLRTVDIYFPNARKGDVCTEVFPVHRDVAAGSPFTGAVTELLAGPTDDERDLGYEGWFSADTAGMLNSLRIQSGIAYVDFATALRDAIPGASSSCGSSSLLAMLDTTMLQFPEVVDTQYSLDGDVAAFYEWLQLSPPDGTTDGTTDDTTDDSTDDTTAMAEWDVHFPNEVQGDSANCGEVFPVSRPVPATTPLRGVLEALLAGPTEAEIDLGYGGWFSAETAGMLNSVRIEDGVAYVDFDGALADVIPGASTSCGSMLLLAQLDQTVEQFPTVDRVVYMLDGSAEAFYSWLQMEVPTG